MSYSSSGIGSRIRPTLLKFLICILSSFFCINQFSTYFPQKEATLYNYFRVARMGMDICGWKKKVFHAWMRWSPEPQGHNEQNNNQVWTWADTVPSPSRLNPVSLRPPPWGFCGGKCTLNNTRPNWINSWLFLTAGFSVLDILKHKLFLSGVFIFK